MCSKTELHAMLRIQHAKPLVEGSEGTNVILKFHTDQPHTADSLLCLNFSFSVPLW